MPRLSKVLVANRGEIAVRVIRACRDAGLASVAVYADADRDALYVRLADEAYALGGSTAADTYLRIDKLLDAAAAGRRRRASTPATASCPRTPSSPRPCIDAGLTWIGPTPQAIRDLGDKVTARHIAKRAGAPLVPGTADPVAGADEIVAFAEEHGLPVAIKAAFGGGGRGLKVARTVEEIPELFESATREAVAAFGRGECFVERYLDQPRHVEAQVLADQHGNVIVVGTRDCSLQRRHQKLVEEAPAPFLTDEQRAHHPRLGQGDLPRGRLPRRRHGRVPGRPGRHDLVPRGQHPPAGRAPGHRGDLRARPGPRAVPHRRRREAACSRTRQPRGHSIEFRINGEDPGRNFLPAPGTVTGSRFPAGPGVRVDTGIEAGTVIGGNFDSLLAKVIVTGADRAQALERARRALDELLVEGMATALPFHRAVVATRRSRPPPRGLHRAHPVDRDRVGQHRRRRSSGGDGDDEEPRRGRSSSSRSAASGWRSRCPATWRSAAAGGRRRSGASRRASAAAARAASAASGDALTAPMQGTIVKVAVADGDTVPAGDLIVVLEAMKMEQPLTAHKAGTVTGLAAAAGQLGHPGHGALRDQGLIRRRIDRRRRCRPGDLPSEGQALHSDPAPC